MHTGNHSLNRFLQSSSGTKMTETRKEQGNTHYERTSLILERRRSLFPSDIDSDENSDLGHISPLHFDSDFEDFSCLPEEENQLILSKTDSIEDYDILGVVENFHGSISTPVNAKYDACSEVMSPLHISPCIKFNDSTVINETPSKISPSVSPVYKLKTPHDTCNTNSKLPKLVRKSLLDSTENSFNKRQLSPYNSPDESKNKHLKLDSKNSKVRTTLFPEVDISLPTKSFYPKTESVMDKIQYRKSIPKSPVSHNSTRKGKTRKRIGQINAGVGHKIRKPKQKTLSKLSLVKAAMNTVNGSAINDYIKDLKQLNATKNEKSNLIENKENSSPQPAYQIIDQKCLTSKLIKSTKIDTSDEVNINNKRPLSPALEPDPKRKFFKYSRAKGVVTVNKNIKVQVDHGKMTLLEKGKKKVSHKMNFDSSDLTVEEPLLPNLDKILTSLENDNNDIDVYENGVNKGSKIVLQAHNSVSASENSILLHPQPSECTANLILSPISQMCDVTSGLALNSPKKAKNLTSILNEISNGTLDNVNVNDIFNKENSSQKMFPIFYGKNSAAIEKKENKGFSRTAKKFKNLEESQMLIDAGQKKFGVIQCSECSFIYHIGDPSDEKMHLNYHTAGHVLKFGGWKNEKVVADFYNDGRIIQIVPGDSKIWWKKVKDLMDVISRELGCYELEFNLDSSQVFLYIKSRTIVGCIVAVSKSEGYKMLSSQPNEADMCSQHSYPIKCGISRIWVSHNYRKQGIGAALMNAMKRNFMFGYILENCDIALSPPTEMGKIFAKSYFKTPNYLIYYM